MLIKDLAKLIDLSSSSTEIEGQSSAISNLMNLHFALFLKALNHSNTVEVLLHWLYWSFLFSFQITFELYICIEHVLHIVETNY